MPKRTDRKVINYLSKLILEVENKLDLQEEMELQEVYSLKEWMVNIRKNKSVDDNYDVLEDIMNRGAKTVLLWELACYDQTNLINSKFEIEIYSLIQSYEKETGSSIVSTFWKERGSYEGFVQSIVWLAVEITAAKLYDAYPTVKAMEQINFDTYSYTIPNTGYYI